MGKPPNKGVGHIINLAEITLAGGVIRKDRSRLAFKHALTLGYFGIPHINDEKAKVQYMV